MKSPLIRHNILTLTILLLSFSTGEATDKDKLLNAFDQLYSPTLDESLAYDVNGLTIKHHDFELLLDSGTVYFARPVVLDSVPHYCIALFRGNGMFRFHPAVQIEKDQLMRYVKSDSLNRAFSQAELMLSDIHYALIDSAGTRKTPVITADLGSTLQAYHGFLIEDEQKYNILQALKALTIPAAQPFLLVNTKLASTGQVLYKFNPYANEEVQLRKHSWDYGLQGLMEPACQYSVYLNDTYTSINGFSKEQIKPVHYTIDSDVDDKGNCVFKAVLEFDVKAPAQIVTMSLGATMVVDSVVNSDGAQVSFIRWDNEKYRSDSLYIIFDNPLEMGSQQSLKFYYHGQIPTRGEGLFYADAGTNWYPRYGYRLRSTYEMTFSSPDYLKLLAIGKMAQRRTSAGIATSTWKVTEPTVNVTFSVGERQRYEFLLEGSPPVEVHYPGLKKMTFDSLALAESPDLVDPAEPIVGLVSADITNSLKLFAHYFGPCIQSKLTVTEKLNNAHADYPGCVPVEWPEVGDVKKWSEDRRMRALAIARQWWGTGVDYATYHDQWLSEGFAEYSSLLYAQAATGYPGFMSDLHRYRDAIFAGRYGSESTESGPIALGYRTGGNVADRNSGLVIHKKAAFVLHMIRNLLIDFETMNEDPFFAMMREWYDMGKGRNMTTADFKLLAEKYTKIDMTWFFNQFVFGQDLPTYEFSYEITKDSAGSAVIFCSVNQTGVPDDFMMFVPLEIEFENGGKYILRLLVDHPTNEVSLPPIEGRVKKLTLNPFHSVLARVIDLTESAAKQ